jgi:hypothetical protein
VFAGALTSGSSTCLLQEAIPDGEGGVITCWTD